MQRIIITGAPCTGKTTILQTLAKMGYSTFDEVAREVIKQELHKGSDVLPWQNINAFSKAVLPFQINNFKKDAEGRMITDGVFRKNLKNRFGKNPNPFTNE